MSNENSIISILGSGWLGLPLAKSLQQDGKNIRVSTRSQAKAKQLSEQNLKSYVVDIENELTDVLPFLQAETLIINITSKQFTAYQALVAEIEKSPIKHVLFVSSTSVYANDQGWCKESDTLTHETNLRLIEKLFTDNPAFDCSVIRFAGLIGPKRHPGRFFASGKSIRDGDAKVNLIHQLDCIKLVKVVIAQGAWGEIFNGCADNHPSKSDYYSTMAKSLGYPEPNCQFSDNAVSKIVCNEKVKVQLNYQFIFPDIYKVIC
ncbi:NAD(P)H-binding protein [Vibrio sp. 1-Bac 57]|uniref:NAD(P)H-binding protein n=1 Tax=Psychromonas arctica TaxID=168275 RepID=UPI00040A713B|nr:NAD(P)H-binding protein [Psychromonas arctica]